MKTIRLLLAAALGGTALVAARADIDVSISAEIRLGRIVAPPPPEIEIVDLPTPKGPPPWAHGHWFARERVYYFYPEAAVYYRPADRMWFYLDGGAWRFGVALPTAVRVDFDRNVELRLSTDKPFEQHRDVIAYYPPSYFRHVKIKGSPPGHATETRGHGRADDRGGDDRGKAKGRGKGRDKEH